MVASSLCEVATKLPGTHPLRISSSTTRWSRLDFSKTAPLPQRKLTKSKARVLLPHNGGRNRRRKVELPPPPTDPTRFKIPDHLKCNRTKNRHLVGVGYLSAHNCSAVYVTLCAAECAVTDIFCISKRCNTICLQGFGISSSHTGPAV